MLQAKNTGNVKPTAETVDRAIEILRGRVDGSSASPSPRWPGSVTTASSSSCADVQDPAQAKEVIGRTAQLTVHPVIGQAA